MYETIDEIDLPGATIDAEQMARRRLWVSGGVVLGLAILFAASVLTTTPPKVQDTDFEAAQAEQSAYRAALTDPEPALRRARLKDFIAAYPESARLTAAKAQLRVLDAREAEDWAELTNRIYDIQSLKLEKEAALSAYEARWSSALLGSRGEALQALRGRVEAQDDDINNGLLMIPDGFPDPVPADDMLGGPDSGSDMRIRVPNGAGGDLRYGAAATIELPRIRRNVTPRYPRRAQRRGVEAQIVLRLFIDDRGRVEMTELVSTRAERYEDDFIEAAEYAALRTRFYPKTVNGEPVPSAEIEKRYRFQMED